ncbi:Phosphatidate cytidylyltransferase [hydrothermal vent metagenome]|uniref:Phosphatidate cytidylyltransferase n=1 Tax=hydrothermal vent metagenome TaxID=652676 RepID=A0A3B0ZIU2_9ZZZZ
MLKLRILTAVILAPLVILAIFKLPNMYFTIFTAIIFLLASWEWARLIGLKTVVSQAAYIAFITIMMLVGLLVVAPNYNLLLLILGIAFIVWLMMFYYVLGYAGMTYPKLAFKARHGLMGVLIIIVPFIAIIVLRNDERYGPGYLFGLLLLLWVADSAAYFAGKKWGKTKLAMRVSPGKSWEGVWGALVATSIYTVLVTIKDGFPTVQAFAIVILSMATVLFSILGDLLESRYKREADRKDSSNILPGHGGILDRIDSLTAAAPIFLLCLMVMGIPE